MGRHNTVAGRMAESAALRGKVFTKLARAITVAARSGSDPNSNPALRTAVAKAKENSMPKDNIERAIKKGSGEGKDATQFEEVLYEGFGPGGVALLVEVLTDNRNRTFPELRVIFKKGGGNLGGVGSVSWMFQKNGTEYTTEHELELVGESAQKARDLIDAIYEQEDVQNIYTNAIFVDENR